MTFEIKIQDGKFSVTYCTKCQKSVWPPSEFCNRCFMQSTPKMISSIGTLIEFSKKNGEYFGLAEFDEKIRLIGKIISDEIPKEGMDVRLEKSSLIDGNYNFEMKSV